MTPIPCRDCGVLPVARQQVVVADDEPAPVLVCPSCHAGVVVDSDEADLTCYWNRTQGDPGWDREEYPEIIYSLGDEPKLPRCQC